MKIKLLEDIFIPDLLDTIKKDTYITIYEEISEGLGKSLAGLGMAAALGGGMLSQTSDEHQKHDISIDNEHQRTELAVQDNEQRDEQRRSQQNLRLMSSIIANMAQNPKRSSLGGIQQNRSQAQSLLMNIQNQVNDNKINPEDGLRIIQSRYNIDDNITNQLKQLFGLSS